jgi:hypothetical protein
MPKGPRKGFKFKKTSKPVTTETISYDQVEHETTTTPHQKSRKQLKGDKRKDNDASDSRASKSRKTSNKSSSPAKSNKSNKHNDNVDPVEEDDPNKSRYPQIAFPLNKISSFVKANRGKKTHGEILDKITVDVCAAESTGLESYFNNKVSSDDHHKGRQEVLRVMKEVLDEIPTEVTSNCPEDSIFHPEFVPGEKTEVAVLNNVLNALKEQTALMSQYESDVSELVTDHGLWINGIPEADIQAYSSQAENSDNGSNANIEETKKSYEEILTDIETTCQGILEDTKKISEVESQAAKTQERLYNSYNKVRFDSAAGIPLPDNTDTKDLVKNLQKK